jgi:hypothetical protein
MKPSFRGGRYESAKLALRKNAMIGTTMDTPTEILGEDLGREVVVLGLGGEVVGLEADTEDIKQVGGPYDTIRS